MSDRDFFYNLPLYLIIFAPVFIIWIYDQLFNKEKRPEEREDEDYMDYSKNFYEDYRDEEEMDR